MSERPSCVETRERIGDLEVDLMMGAHHKSALLVITDRATLITGIEKLESKNASLVCAKIIEKLSRFNSSWVKTITFDNGKEFSQHEKIAKALNAKSYFTRPYTSQDKGTVENRIGMIRRFFPKKTDLRDVSHQRVREVERMINQRPVRKFNYLSPVQKLKTKCVALIS